jgi:hypothetical protein
LAVEERVDMLTRKVIKRVLLTIVVIALLLITPDLIGLGIASFSIENMARQAARYASTGQYNPQYCQDIDGDTSTCGGNSKRKEVAVARLRSIHDVAHAQQGLLQVNHNTTWDQPGYLHVIVCSRFTSDKPRDGVPNFIATIPSQGGFSAESYARCTLDDHEMEDPSYVAVYQDRRINWAIVMVDYNYSFWLPLFRSFWPYFHLAATREAIVEMYR